jgi:hypothetical protein
MVSIQDDYDRSSMLHLKLIPFFCAAESGRADSSKVIEVNRYEVTRLRDYRDTQLRYKVIETPNL